MLLLRRWNPSRPADKRGQVLEIDGRHHSQRQLQLQPRSAAFHDSHAGRAARGTRRILVAGEMLELGEHAPALHAACGKAAAEAGIDLVVGVRAMPNISPQRPAPAAWLAIFLPDAEAAGEWLAQNLQPGDVVLVKGSRGVHLERAIEVLKNKRLARRNQ